MISEEQLHELFSVPLIEMGKHVVCRQVVKELVQECFRLREALKFYADKENWNEGDMELGDLARKTLWLEKLKDFK